MTAGRPLSLRVSVTDRCSARCAYCMPSSDSAGTIGRQILSDEEIRKRSIPARDVERIYRESKGEELELEEK